MMKNKLQKVVALSFALSIAATGLSLFAVLGGGGINDSDFNGRVEASINAFIEKQQNPEARRVAEKVKNDIEDDDAVEGNAGAPLTLVEFSDYQCPYCGRFVTQTLGQLRDNYIAKGKLKLVFRDFPLDFHPNAKPAAVAAECARNQSGDEAYIAFHDLIFKNQATLSPESLSEHAAALKLNMAKFSECLASDEFDEEIAQDLSDGQTSGITGTPGFLLLMEKDNKKADDLKAMELSQQGQFIIQYIETEDGKRMGLRISGAHPYSTFEKAIEVGL